MERSRSSYGPALVAALTSGSTPRGGCSIGSDTAGYRRRRSRELLRICFRPGHAYGTDDVFGHGARPD
jgi:hypothetical protein